MEESTVQPLHEKSHAIRGVFISLISIILFSCAEKRQHKASIEEKKIIVKPATTKLSTEPRVIRLDTCPKPRMVTIPTKPGAFAQRKSATGMRMIRSLPPALIPAVANVDIKEYKTEDGLPIDIIWSLFEDRKGALWIGTSGGGVTRYDGKTFTTFNMAHGLGSNHVMSIFEDRKGNLWFCTGIGGLSCYDGRKFTTYTTKHGLASDRTGRGIEDKDGILWITTSDGLSSFDPIKKTFKNYTVADGLLPNLITCILEDTSGNIWIGYWRGGGLTRFDKSRQTFYNVPGMAAKDVSQVFQDKNGNYFIACYNGLYFLSKNDFLTYGDNARFIEIHTDNNLGDYAIGLLQDKTGKIWVSKTHGLCSFDPTTASFSNGYPVYTSYGKEQGLIVDDLMATIEDHKGNMWIGTGGNGLLRMDRGGRLISRYTTEGGLANNHVFCAVEDTNQNMMFGTEGGISILDREKQFFTNITTAQGLVDYWTYSLIEDRNKDIWFCTSGDGLSRMDKDRKTITTYSTSQGLPSNLIIYVFEDRNGIKWLGSDAGLCRFDGTSMTNYTMENGLISNLFNEILEDSDGNLWLATEGGVSRLNLNGKSLPGQRISITNFSTEQGLANNNIISLFEDSEKNIWVGSRAGLSRFDGKSFLNLTTSDGLPDDGIGGMEMDKAGNIWFGSDKGICLLKGFLRQKGTNENQSEKEFIPINGKYSNAFIEQGNSELVFEVFHTTTGYPIKDLFGHGLRFSRGNDFWIGTGENLVHFNYDLVERDQAPPIPWIQQIRVSNEKVTWNDLLSSHRAEQDSANHGVPAALAEELTLFGKKLSAKQRDTLHRKFANIQFDSVTPYYPVPLNLRLPFDHNNLTFEFGVIETDKPDMIQYQFMLEGYDKEWSPISGASAASFGNIHEGNYTFKLKARSPDGIWSEPVLYHFKVLPPWYRSWWAYTIYIIGLITAVWNLIRWRVSALKKEKLSLEKRIVERTMELRDEKEKVESTLKELRSTQGQLIQSAKMASLGELTAGIAHEIQNPLNFVNNFSEVSKELMEELRNEKKKEERNIQNEEEILTDIEQNLEKITHHGKRADSIVKGMLQHSRTSTGQKEPTDINVLADEYLRLAYSGFKAKDKSYTANLATNFDHNIGKINLAPQEIGRVLLNLINNAFYAVSEKQKQNIPAFEPKVTVSTKRLRDQIEIRVTDNGNGIPQKVLDKIFQPFFTTKPTGQGTGLGLSLAYDIVTKGHGGELKVETREGQGSEFIIQLPLQS